MKLGICAAAAAAAALIAGQAAAQEKVVGAPNPDALFKDKNPKYNKNKQAAYHIEKELLECGEWDRAGEWLTKAYHQHNPNAQSGLDGVVFYFTKVLKVQPKPCPEKMTGQVVAVLADGDNVTVITPREVKDPKDPSKSYWTTWFDNWRFVDGKADEHWDPANKQ